MRPYFSCSLKTQPCTQSQLDEAVNKARRLKMSVPVYVYAIDNDPGARQLRMTTDESYINSCEFEAFCGEVVCIVNTDGTLD